MFLDGHELAMGAPYSGRLVVWTPTSEKVISETAGASMVWSEDSRFLAFTEWTKDRKQTIFVCRIADFAIDWLPEFSSVIELHKFKDGWITGVKSPFSKEEPFAIEHRKAQACPKKTRDQAWWISGSQLAFRVFLSGALLVAIALIGIAFTEASGLGFLALGGGIIAVSGFCGYVLAQRKLRQFPLLESEQKGWGPP